MKVALVHDWLTGMRGGEKCLEVFCELYPDADLFTLVYTAQNVSPTIQRMNVRTSWLNRLPAAPKYFRYLLPLFPQAVESFDLADYDLILSSSHCVAKGILPQRSLHISYIFAPMRYVWDLHDAYVAGSQSWIGRVGLSIFRSYLQRWDVRSSARVDYFVAESQNIASKIARFYQRPSKVIYPPVDFGRFSISRDLQPFYLIVSALVPYKRVDLAIEAFNALKLPLKVVGDGPLRRALTQRANSNIEFLGWLDDVKVAELYAWCQALIFPGEEDFGIVPLEAQAAGRPVIAFKRGGLLETVIGLDEAASQPSPTGIFFTDQSAESLIAAVRRYERHRNRFEPEQIRAHARRFGRDRFKGEIADYVRECLTHYRSGV
jgi:glycosyltransferase involved in cell wall biosynthesis